MDPFRCILFRSLFSLALKELKLQSSPYLIVEMLERMCGGFKLFWRGILPEKFCLVVCVLSSLFDVLLVVSRANVCEVDCAVRTGRFTKCTVLVKQEVTQFWETLRNHSSMCGFSFSVYLFFSFIVTNPSVCYVPPSYRQNWWLHSDGFLESCRFWCGVFFEITLL